MPRRPDLTADHLIAHAGFVRALARSLLADEAEVDDVVQETWVRALESGPRRAEALGAWLRTVTRNLAFKRARGRERRLSREREVARGERVASTAELVERESSLKGVVGCVLALPEHYREVVLLRYFEDLPPRKIAARLDVPVTTVRMRLFRAHRQLREALDREHGGDRERCTTSLAFLAGLSRDGEPAAAPLLLVASIGALAAGVAVLALWSGRGGKAVEGLGPGAPAPDTVAQSSEPSTVELPARAPVLGQATGSAGDAGASDEALDAIAGIVVDAEGAPVSGAAVLGEWGGGGMAVHARTGESGRFALRLPADRVDGARSGRLRSAALLAARAGGHAPSAIVAWPAGRPPEDEVVLRLRGPGATIRGRVVGAGGAPVPGATVQVGESYRLGRGFFGATTRLPGESSGRLLPALVVDPEQAAFQTDGHTRGFLGAQVLSADGTPSRLPPPLSDRTDSAGRFELTSVEPGPQPLTVHAIGAPSAELQVDPAGHEVLELEIRLAAGATLEGTLRRADGLPVKSGVVYVFGEGTGVAERVAPDGAYRIEALPAGRFTLFAESPSRDPVLSAATEVELAPGETLRWDPELDEAARVAGRLVDEQERGVEGWTVELRLDRNPSRSVASTRTAADGSFALHACPPLAAHLYFAHGDGARQIEAKVVGGVRPGADLGAVVVSAAERSISRLSGTLRMADGAPAREGTTILLYPRGRTASFALKTDPAGRFASEPLPPGEYRIVVPEHGLAHVAEETLPLEPGGDLRLGDLSLPELGALEIRPSEEGASERVALRIARVCGDGTRIPVFLGRAELPVRVPLGPGRWEADFPGRDVDAVVTSVAPGGSVRVQAPGR